MNPIVGLMVDEVESLGAMILPRPAVAGPSVFCRWSLPTETSPTPTQPQPLPPLHASIVQINTENTASF